MILLDTNVLGRMTDAADPQYAVARRAGPPPNGQNGLGMTAEQASQWLGFFQRRFTLLPDREELLPHWHDMVRRLGITGIRSHDARLVAAMQTYGIERLLTFNVEHFRRFSVAIIDPASF